MFFKGMFCLCIDAGWITVYNGYIIHCTHRSFKRLGSYTAFLSPYLSLSVLQLYFHFVSISIFLSSISISFSSLCDLKLFPFCFSLYLSIPIYTYLSLLSVYLFVCIFFQSFYIFSIYLSLLCLSVFLKFFLYGLS